MRCAYPLLLDLTDRHVVIVGGGAVAARKATGVVAAGAKSVTVVAPTLTATLPQGVQHLAARYEPMHLTAADLVFAATDQADVNATVVRDARAAGILVNRADTDEADPGDFTVPAMLRRGALTVAVSASGAPALAAKIRDVIGTHLDERWRQLAEMTQKLRPLILSSIPDAGRRRAALQELASDRAAEQAAEGEARLVDWLAGKFPELKGSD